MPDTVTRYLHDEMNCLLKDYDAQTMRRYNEFCNYMLVSLERKTVRHALCNSLEIFCGKQLYTLKESEDLKDYQQFLFITEADAIHYPFNLTQESYLEEFTSKTLYDNIHRLNWLKRFSDPASH